MPDLATLQRRIWRLVTAPSGVAAALAEGAGLEERSLDGWLASDARSGATDRLDVYAQAYFARIREALAEDFGALAATLGDDGFHDLVTAYLCVHPPERPSLRNAGDRLAGFLDRHAAGAPFRKRWPFAADLASLERALVDAFDAPDLPVLTREDLAAVAPEAWSDLILRLHPSVRRLRLRHAVLPLREAWTGGRPAEPPAAPAPSEALVWRCEERVSYRRLPSEEALLLGAVQQSASFGLICERVAASVGDAEAPSRAAGWLSGWVESGLLLRGSPPPSGRLR